MVYIIWNFAEHSRLEYLYYKKGEYFDPANNISMLKSVCKNIFPESCHSMTLEKDRTNMLLDEIQYNSAIL